MNIINKMLPALVAMLLPLTASAYQLTVRVTPSNGGSAYGGGSYDAGQGVSVRAYASDNYSFLGWFDDRDNFVSDKPEISYPMPERDVTLTARMAYDPKLPDEPQAPVTPEPTYTVSVVANPSDGGSVSITNGYYTYASVAATAGSQKTVTANASSNWVFSEWRDDQGNVVSTVNKFTYTWQTRDVVLTAHFNYEPGVPADPGGLNKWDPFTGELIILKIDGISLSNTCNALISSSERPLVKKLVIADPNYNSTDSNIDFIRLYLTNVEVVDLQNTAYVNFRSSELAIPSMKKLLLPAGTTSFHTSTFTTSNSQLEEIWIYAVTPPSSGASALTKIPSTCVIYVPNENVAAYKAADYWNAFEIRPMVSENNAVGPDEEGYNDLSLLHKFPFTYTYTGADGGSVEYMAEEDGEWHTLRSDLENGAEISANALVTFSNTRLLHTVDFRVVDGASVTPLPEKRIELADLRYSSTSIPGSWVYDYGNPVEASVVISGIVSDGYLTEYVDNRLVGKATAKVSGNYPVTIGTRTDTYYIRPLPLPGNVEFTDPEVSLVYRNEDIKPEWRFTDPRNAALVKDTDFTESWQNVKSVGTATLTLTGKGNFTGSIVFNYDIVKGPVLPLAYTYYLTYPDEEILYDGEAHGFSQWNGLPKEYGYGRYYEYYDHETHEKLSGTPTEPGVYEGWIGFTEGPNTLAADPVCKIVYTIFKMEDSEWEAIQDLSADLDAHGFKTGWNFSSKLNALRYAGLTMKRGWVTEVSFPNKSMTGTFPASILAFSELKKIDLSGNRLSGSFDGLTQMLANVESVNISNNIFSGDLALLADIFPNMTVLKASGNRFSQINRPMPSTIATLEYASQNTGVTVDLDYTSADRTAFYSAFPSIVRYNHASGTFGFVTDLWITTSAYDDVALLPNSSWAARLTPAGVEKVSENVVFTGENGGMIRCLTADNINFEANFSFLRGDADFDLAVTVLDLQATINALFEELDTESPFNRTAADTKADGSINVFDVVTTVSIMMQTPLHTLARAARAAREAQSDSGGQGDACCDSAAAYVCVSDGRLQVTSDVPVSALDIHVQGADFAKRQHRLDELGFSYSVSGDRLVAYSLSGATIPAGTTDIAEVPAGSAVAAAMLSDSRAKTIPVSVSVTTGIDNLDADVEEGEWFNLQGVRIKAPVMPGVYIHNNKKIVIK